MPDKEHMQFTERTVADSPSKSKEDRDASYYNSVIVDVSCSELALKQKLTPWVGRKLCLQLTDLSL